MCSTVISILSKREFLLRELQKKLPHIHFHKVENSVTDEQLRKSKIIVGDFSLIGPHLYELSNARWIQGTSAGVDMLLKHVKPEKPPNILVTRFTGRHFGTEMSEYVVSQIINHERNLFVVWDNQKMQQWLRVGKISMFRTLPELRIGILGLGTIGFRIAKILRLMGAKVIGLGRSDTLDPERNNDIEKYFNRNNVSQFLEKCDYVINILPETEESKGFLNGNVLESCKGNNTVFINIGRGTVISEETLINALEQKWISAAILDVFEQEPLNSESPLWKMPNVIITPHVAGAIRPQDVAEFLSENLERFQQNLTLSGVLDFSRGY